MDKSVEHTNENPKYSKGAANEKFSTSENLRSLSPPPFQAIAKTQTSAETKVIGEDQRTSHLEFESKSFKENLSSKSTKPISLKSDKSMPQNTEKVFPVKAWSPNQNSQSSYESDERDSPVIQKNDGKTTETSATGVSLGDSYSLDNDKKYGLVTPINVRGTNLADVLDSELVGTSIDHTGSMAKKPSAKSNNSGFMAADNIPDDRHTSSKSQALKYFDSHGGEGSYARLQMDLFKIPKKTKDQVFGMDNSGYRLKREVKKEGNKVLGIITKTAEAVTIGKYTSGAGLTAKKQAKVTLRDDTPKDT